MFGDSAEKTDFFFGDSTIASGGSPARKSFGTFGGASPSKASKMAPEQTQSLLPLTIEQVVTAPLPEDDEPFKVDNVELHMVVVVGRINSKDARETSTVVELSDKHDNVVQLKTWSFDHSGEPSKCDRQLSAISEGEWIRVVGKVQVFKGMKSLNPFDIQPASEVEARYWAKVAELAHFENLRKGDTSRASPSRAHMSAIKAPTGDKSSRMDTSFGGGVDTVDDDMMDANQKKVYDFLRKIPPTNTLGGDVAEIRKGLPEINLSDLRETLESMVSDGMIYTTIDDEHFRIT